MATTWQYTGSTDGFDGSGGAAQRSRALTALAELTQVQLPVGKWQLKTVTSVPRVPTSSSSSHGH